MTIKLIVLDCDGVLSGGEAQPFNLTLLSRLTALNRRARRGEAAPAVTLNTGRPAPYVEAVLQAIDGWQPALFENGAGLYFPQTYRFQLTPAFTAERRAALDTLLAALDREVVQPGRAYWQPGKQVCHTLFAHPPLSVADILPQVAGIAANVAPDFLVEPAKLALNIYPRGINKGSGLIWLAKETGIDPDEMAGVGDSAGDVPFLQRVGRAAAPGNATDEARLAVNFTAPHPDSDGLADILDHWRV